MRRFWTLAIILVALTGCKEEPPEENVIRGLKTHLIVASEPSTQRRYPGVLEPSELTTLSFEVGGKLKEVSLTVGQSVSTGDVIAEIDPRSLEIQVENLQAGLAQAEANAKNAAEALERQRTLLERGAVTQVAVDDAETLALTSAATVEQAQKALDSAREDLEKAVLVAPFDGIVNAVDVESFANVSAGSPVASIYSPNAFEVSFSVNFETANQLVVGKPATIRLADRPEIVLDAVVSELGSRADTVSSFPIVLQVTEGNPVLKAGMAVEAEIEFPLPADEGFLIPLSATINQGQITGGGGGSNDPGKLAVYVYDPETSTVNRREALVAGVRENSLLIIDGLEEGERIASAGVSFLQDGQKVKLLDEDQ